MAKQRQHDLDLAKFVPLLATVPDEVTMGSLQDALETLLSEGSHPMVVALTKQRDQLRHANDVIEHEKALRISRKSSQEEETKKRVNVEGDWKNAKRQRTSRGVEDTADVKDDPDNVVDDEDSRSACQESSSRLEEEQHDTGTDLKVKSPSRSANHKNVANKKLSSTEPHTNTKFVTNPKAEYVDTQSMPLHTFSVFKEGDEADEDEEAYKRRLGVVSYPKEDMSTLTTGPVPMEDLTGGKPSNQVQFSTYATFLEPYFRPFTEKDMQFLEQSVVGSAIEAINLKTGRKLSPYVIPPLGPDYHYNWAIQDAELSGIEVSASARKQYESHFESLTKAYDAAGGISDFTESNLESNTAVSLGPFTERLIAAIVSETPDNGNPQTHDPTAPANPISVPGAPSQVSDFTDLEERVKSEFQNVGVLDMSLLQKSEQEKVNFRLAAPSDDFGDAEVDWINSSEDDEICRELRTLQAKLRAVSSRNAFYKQRLLPVIQEQLSWQEYQSILQDLDKQVDQAYMRRQKSQPPKPKKKPTPGRLDSPLESNGATPTPATPEVRYEQKPTIKALIDKRARWISKIGPLFRSPHQMMREYEAPKFANPPDELASDVKVE